MNALRRSGAGWKDRRLIGNLCMGQKTEGEFSEPGVIGGGIRQGWPLSPILFNVYIKGIMRVAMDGVTESVKVGGRLTKALRITDDQTMLAGSQNGLLKMMDPLSKVSEEYDVKIDIK